MRFFLADRIKEIEYGDHLIGIKAISLADDTFNDLLNRVEEATSKLNPAALREAKGKLEKGVVDPKAMKGRGRKP